MKFLVRMLVSAGALFGVAYLSDQGLLNVESFWPAAILAAVVLAIVNVLVKPIVTILTLPVTILTLGLFGVVVNALMLYLVAWIVPGVETTGFWQTILASIIISFTTAIVTKMVDANRA